MYDVLTVSALNTYIKSVIDSDQNLNNILLRGEVSNLANHYSSGHVYFTLKDKGSSVRAVMFKRYAQELDFPLREGMELIVRCKPTIYEKDGAYQIYVYDATDYGAGRLYLKYKELAEKLSSEGVFSEERKKPIPKYAERIAVVSSKNAAALQDVLNIIRRRNPSVSVSIFPARVQGEGADRELIEALKKADSMDFDVIIIARGGGSIEDLWQFNSESLARFVATLKTPTISAVGHETDTTLCDLASDLRASTPSAGAELAVSTRQEILAELDSFSSDIEYFMSKKLEELSHSLATLEVSFSYDSFNEAISQKQNMLNSYGKEILDKLRLVQDKSQDRLIFLSKLIEEQNPISILTKGFSLCKKDDHTIKSSKELKSGDKIEIIFADGSKGAKIEE